MVYAKPRQCFLKAGVLNFLLLAGFNKLFDA